MTHQIRRPAIVCAIGALLPTLVAQLTAQTGAQTGAPVAQQFERLHFRSVGPAIMSGRIADLAVYEKNPAIWYVGTAHGGVWKTSSNGALLTPIFENNGPMDIGYVTVSQTNLDAVCVGSR